MRSGITAVIFFCLLAGNSRAQISGAMKDSLRWQQLKSTGMYPVIKNNELVIAFPVPGLTERVDPSMKYKLLFEMTVWGKDSLSKTALNEGLAEIGRIINLHVAAGVPKENLELAIVIKGSALNVYLKNELYLKKFKTNNPNLDILKQFSDLKIPLIACGQSEVLRNISPADFIPDVKTAFSAKVAVSTYQLKGYVLYEIEGEK